MLKNPIKRLDALFPMCSEKKSRKKVYSLIFFQDRKSHRKKDVEKKIPGRKVSRHKITPPTKKKERRKKKHPEKRNRKIGPKKNPEQNVYPHPLILQGRVAAFEQQRPGVIYVVILQCQMDFVVDFFKTHWQLYVQYI